MNGQYSISVVQLPIRPITGAVHDIILFTDSQNRFLAEIDGGPIVNGRMAVFNLADPASLIPYLPLANYPLGVQISNTQLFWNPSLGLGTEVASYPSMSGLSQVLAGAFLGMRDVNRAERKYGLWDINSNSVANTILQCMGV